MATWATATTGARVKALQRLLRPRRAQPRRARPRRVAQRALRRRLPRPPRRRAQPRRRRRCLGDNRVAPPAPMTLSAAPTSATRPADVAPCPAAPATPTLSAASELAGTEDVADRLARNAPLTVSAVSGSAATSAYAQFDCFPNSFPCTRSGHSAL